MKQSFKEMLTLIWVGGIILYFLDAQTKNKIITEITTTVVKTIKQTVQESFKKTLPEDFVDKTTVEAVKPIKSYNGCRA